MKKICKYWKEYASMAGLVSYCELAAFNRKVAPGYLGTIGCTKEKRENCKVKMEFAVGFGLIPEVKKVAEPVEKVHDLVALVGMAG